MMFIVKAAQALFRTVNMGTMQEVLNTLEPLVRASSYESHVTKQFLERAEKGQSSAKSSCSRDGSGDNKYFDQLVVSTQQSPR